MTEQLPGETPETNDCDHDAERPFSLVFAHIYTDEGDGMATDWLATILSVGIAAFIIVSPLLMLLILAGSY